MQEIDAASVAAFLRDNPTAYVRFVPDGRSEWCSDEALFKGGRTESRHDGGMGDGRVNVVVDKTAIGPKGKLMLVRPGSCFDGSYFLAVITHSGKKDCSKWRGAYPLVDGKHAELKYQGRLKWKLAE